MTMPPRHPCVHHCTSEPYRFFGRAAELALLDGAAAGGPSSVVALVGPGGQGKTAIVQHWLHHHCGLGIANCGLPDNPQSAIRNPQSFDGVFLWSFYRGQDANLCLRSLFAYAEHLARPPEVSATYCVDHLLPILRRERWVLILDGTEVAQHDRGTWFGRFMHPELSRLLEELASEPLPGVVLLTTRFPLPELERRPHAVVRSLENLDDDSSRALLRSLGVNGDEAELEAVVMAGGRHAKAVELLGTYLRRFHRGDAARLTALLESRSREGEAPAEPQALAARQEPRPPEKERSPESVFSPEEAGVLRVLSAFRAALPAEEQDILALATAFRDPPIEERLRQYLVSAPAQALLHSTWGRRYEPFPSRPPHWLAGRIQELVELRLLERVGVGAVVLDAHPLVRRGFENVLGASGRREGAQARAGFLHGRPDRKRPASLEEAREEVELFHAYCDAGLWNEADSTFVALHNPKHRFVAPAFERDLLLRFFPAGDWQRPPLWPGFGRYRALAIAFEMLGQFDDALATYRDSDAALRGDALLALGRLEPLLSAPQMPPPWQTLWGAYRAHALAVAGRSAEAVAVAGSLVPVDVYEWQHVFECLLRANRLDMLDLRSVLYRPPSATEERWRDLARRRMRADYRRVMEGNPANLGEEYTDLIEEYDRGGLPWERALTRLSYSRWLAVHGRKDAHSVAATALGLARRYRMRVIEADAAEGDGSRRP
jgi:hypothetical protein